MLVLQYFKKTIKTTYAYAMYLYVCIKYSIWIALYFSGLMVYFRRYFRDKYIVYVLQLYINNILEEILNHLHTALMLDVSVFTIRYEFKYCFLFYHESYRNWIFMESRSPPHVYISVLSLLWFKICHFGLDINYYAAATLNFLYLFVSFIYWRIFRLAIGDTKAFVQIPDLRYERNSN